MKATDDLRSALLLPSELLSQKAGLDVVFFTWGTQPTPLGFQRRALKALHLHRFAGRPVLDRGRERRLRSNG